MPTSKRLYERDFYGPYNKARINEQYRKRNGEIRSPGRLLKPRRRPPVHRVPTVSTNVPADMYPFVAALRTFREQDIPATPGLLAEALMWGLFHRPAREQDPWTIKMLDLIEELLEAELVERSRFAASRDEFFDDQALDEYDVRFTRLMVLHERILTGDQGVGDMLQWGIEDVG